ncbi:A/G-specific adenine glycosylase [Roseibacillus persicicus]|uniref:A/G-specific adenine glycosylase n=1 Tax=Roseibacillus persicicus TaxID=454148 RepID=UPI002811DAC2|nr:A/G-specific adenine glycosylase [Roseibacillus persicicus]
MLKPEYLSNALQNAERFRACLRKWFEADGQDHPWRKTTDPWAILVSEVMLQQTTVAAVRAGRRFELFLTEFPDLATISVAPEEQLLKAWEGLGYYNRVRNLQKTARAVLEDWGGVFPRAVPDLLALPGVGPYTAGAIASFAYNEPAPIVDGNIARVLARVFDDPTEVDSSQGKALLWNWSEELLDKVSPRIFNSALMEIGQVFCRPKNPNCMVCPIAEFCITRVPDRLPKKKAKVKTIAVVEHALVVRKAGKILLAKEEGSRRKGFYRLPLRTAEEVADLELLRTSKYAITKHRVTLHLYRALEAAGQELRKEERWVPLKEVTELPMASPVRRALEEVLS